MGRAEHVIHALAGQIRPPQARKQPPSAPPPRLADPAAPTQRRLDTQLYFFANQDQLLHVAKLLSKVPQLALSDR
jgi:hypothetical protein